MFGQKHVEFPPLTTSSRRRFVLGCGTQKLIVQEEEGMKAAGKFLQLREVCSTGSTHTSCRRKPHLLVQLENLLNKELQTISPDEPKQQELKLQVYRRVFGCFITAFKTYQPLLSAIKKEYENNLMHQEEQVRELEPLRSHLRLLTEECDRKIQARWKEERAEMISLKREKQRLQGEVETLREREKVAQILVDGLRSELGAVYLRYREERDARKMLIWQLNDLKTRAGAEGGQAAGGDEGDGGDLVQLRLALRVCREDLSRAQEDLARTRVKYWDVVPRRDWEVLDRDHKETQLQMKTLQGDLDQMRTEFNVLLELQRRDASQTRTRVSAAVQTDEILSLVQSDPIEDSINSEVADGETPPSGESREVVRPAESDEESHVMSISQNR